MDISPDEIIEGTKLTLSRSDFFRGSIIGFVSVLIFQLILPIYVALIEILTGSGQFSTELFNIKDTLDLPWLIVGSSVLSGGIVWKFLKLERIGRYREFLKGFSAGILATLIIASFMSAMVSFSGEIESLTMEIAFALLFAVATSILFLIIAGWLFAIIFGLTAHLFDKYDIT